MKLGGKYRPVTDEERREIKRLCEQWPHEVVMKITNRSRATIDKVLNGEKRSKRMEGYFSWKDFNKNIII